MSLQKTLPFRTGVSLTYWKIVDTKFSRYKRVADVTLGGWINSDDYANMPQVPALMIGYQFSLESKGLIESSNKTLVQTAYDAWYNTNKDALSFNGLLDADITNVPQDNPDSPQSPTHDEQVATLEATRKTIPEFTPPTQLDASLWDFTFDNSPLEAQFYSKIKLLPDWQGALDV